MRKLVPLLDRVIVERSKAAERSVGGIILPETSKSKLNIGKVLAVGPGHRDKDGKLVPLTIKVGDHVLLSEYGGTDAKIDDKEYSIYREDDILAILKD